MMMVVEGVEDYKKLVEEDLKNIDLILKDVVIGIVVSGKMLYVIGGLIFVNIIGVIIVFILCNEYVVISEIV